MTEGRYYLLQPVAHCGGSVSPSYTDNEFYCKENDRNCRKVWQLTAWAPAGIFPGGGKLWGALKKSVKGGPHIFLDKL